MQQKPRKRILAVVKKILKNQATVTENSKEKNKTYYTNKRKRERNVSDEPTKKVQEFYFFPFLYLQNFLHFLFPLSPYLQNFFSNI